MDFALLVFFAMFFKSTYLFESESEYSKEWVVQMAGDLNEVKRFANVNGYDFKGKVMGFSNTYILHKRSIRHKRDIKMHTDNLSRDKRVIFVEHQNYKKRTKRDNFKMQKKKAPINLNKVFADPLWPKQWYLHDTRTTLALPKIDLRVIGAWKKNYTGRGAVVSIIDDGIQWNHTDIAANYDPDASYDFNDNDTDPMPRFNEDNKHGTRCAGEVAMVANNKVCGVGLAYNAKIGGIRLLDGTITDRTEAESLQFNIQHVDIYSVSWGPNDDGQTVEGPGRLAGMAIKNGIKNGRGGKGTIYVWASGNGGTHDDDCSCDGYTDSVYTLSVSSASQSGRFPWYGEKCASTIATTYSSGTYTDQRIVTIDVPNKCTLDHTGTSASAPLAAAIIALGLEANPNLTWRDVQHIAVWTSEPGCLIQNPGWHMNGRGLLASTRFGFGTMNAESFVTFAENWSPLPAQKICRTIYPNFENISFNSSNPSVIRFKTDACHKQKNEINYLEHVIMVADISYRRRGSLAIYLISPLGTRTKLLSTRSKDESREGFVQWPFMSVHTWGENPAGYWRVEVYDQYTQTIQEPGNVKNISFVFYGTTEMPAHYSKRRAYNYNYNYKKFRNRYVNSELWDKEDLLSLSRGKRQKLVEIMSNPVTGETEENFLSTSEESDDFLNNFKSY